MQFKINQYELHILVTDSYSFSKKMRIPKLFFLLTGCICLFSTFIYSQESVIEVVNYDFIKRTNAQNIQLLDVRTETEYQQGHISGAVNVDILKAGKLEAYAQKLDPSKPVYLYCHSGGRSHNAALKLKAMGFNKIYDYSGGFSDWSQHKD